MLLLVALSACDEERDGGATSALDTVPIPAPSASPILDQAAAIRLGKALFWDVQAGSDGVTACASCHFKAGTDDRRVNTIAPGPNERFDVVTSAGAAFGGGDLPRSTDDIIGSQGVVGASFMGIDPDAANGADLCAEDRTSPYFAQRRVTGRQAPSVINAVFFRELFWDGRANHQFNGLDPFGATGNNTDAAIVMIDSAALGSQAVGPPLNATEMSCSGRAFNGAQSLGEKMLARRPLAKQRVDPRDSVLGALSAAPAFGLNTSYSDLIAAAFGKDMAAKARDQFSLIWGMAIQAYESTLIAGETPFDRFLAGDRSALTLNQTRGLNEFNDHCAVCHAGPELSDASAAFAAEHGLINEDGGDQGFHNLGVRPTADDLGRAGVGPKGVSWSVSGAAADRGAFKTAALRNVKLTAPYFHNGSAATLEDVVDFYDRHGNFANAEQARQVRRIRLGRDDKDQIVDFLTHALTDCRVEKQRAPFDHPSLPLPNARDGAIEATGAEGTGACP